MIFSNRSLSAKRGRDFFPGAEYCEILAEYFQIVAEYFSTFDLWSLATEGTQEVGPFRAKLHEIRAYLMEIEPNLVEFRAKPMEIFS